MGEHDLDTQFDESQSQAFMRSSGIGGLPVVDDNQLVGIVTSYDFLTATANLFKQHLGAPGSSDKEIEAQAAATKE